MKQIQRTKLADAKVGPEEIFFCEVDRRVGQRPIAPEWRTEYDLTTTNKSFLVTSVTGLAGSAALLAVLTGCVADGPSPRSGYWWPPVAQVRTVVAFQDDYDYNPAYETYYSRNRHEYVYRDGNTWGRRSAPQGVAVNVLLAAPAKAMPETWMQEKDKVGQAWDRTQAAYTRMKSSTTG